MRSYTGIIFKKELIDIVRDRRSILMTLLLPLVLYPLMFWFIGSQTAAQIDGPSLTTIAVTESARVKLEPIFTGESTVMQVFENPVDAVGGGNADVAIIADGWHFRVVYDANRTPSAMSVGHISGILAEYSQVMQMTAISELTGLTFAEIAGLAPISFETATVEAETGEESAGAGMFLSMMLPMILVILLSVGGMPTAVDLFAGEKERRTFEPLLCTAARRTDILAGKLGAVTAMSLVGAVASGAGMVIGYLVNPKAMTMGLDDMQGIALPPVTLLLVLLIIMAMAVFFSGLHILLSTYARSIKEASTYGSFVMLASYIPVFASVMKLGGDFGFWTAFVPVLNVTGSLKMVLAGINDPAYMGVTLGQKYVTRERQRRSLVDFLHKGNAV
jgi:sodium transport system permease protein